MNKLAELNSAIMELNELWSICTDNEQGDKILEQRDTLDRQASDIAKKILREGTPELNDAILALNDLTQTAKSAKEEIDDIAKRIEKTAAVIDKATSAIAKVGELSSFGSYAVLVSYLEHTACILADEVLFEHEVDEEVIAAADENPATGRRMTVSFGSERREFSFIAPSSIQVDIS